MGHPAFDHEAMAAMIIAPSFDAVRDVYVENQKKIGGSESIGKVAFRINRQRHDTERHFAACASNGKLIEIAPEGADLPLDTLVAILCHEFGHASDFLNPGCWEFVSRDKPARWVGDDGDFKKRKAIQRRWMARGDDEIEWCADAIAYAVTGRRVGYCGPCLVQCFDGALRPKGLR